jgi:SpoVK/Ycf46/Vps4 family AAA+-type ATPase
LVISLHYTDQIIASEAKMNFLSVRSSDLLSKYFGDTERQLRALFAAARASSPCVLFFDDFDVLALRRGGRAATAQLLHRDGPGAGTEHNYTTNNLAGLGGNTIYRYGVGNYNSTPVFSVVKELKNKMTTRRRRRIMRRRKKKTTAHNLISRLEFSLLFSTS